MKYELELLRLNTGREVEISTAVTRLVNHLFQYGVGSSFLYTSCPIYMNAQLIYSGANRSIHHFGRI